MYAGIMSMYIYAIEDFHSSPIACEYRISLYYIPTSFQYKDTPTRNQWTLYIIHMYV